MTLLGCNFFMRSSVVRVLPSSAGLAGRYLPCIAHPPHPGVFCDPGSQRGCAEEAPGPTRGATGASISALRTPVKARVARFASGPGLAADSVGRLAPAPRWQTNQLAPLDFLKTSETRTHRVASSDACLARRSTLQLLVKSGT